MHPVCNGRCTEEEERRSVENVPPESESCALRRGLTRYALPRRIVTNKGRDIHKLTLDPGPHRG